MTEDSLLDESLRQILPLARLEETPLPATPDIRLLLLESGYPQGLSLIHI